MKIIKLGDMPEKKWKSMTDEEKEEIIREHKEEFMYDVCRSLGIYDCVKVEDTLDFTSDNEKGIFYAVHRFAFYIKTEDIIEALKENETNND